MKLQKITNPKLLKTKISANLKTPKDIPDFSANGSRVLFPGWLAVDQNSRGEDVELPEVKIGDSLSLINLESEEKFTQSI